MEEPVEERRHGGGVAGQFTPVAEGAVRRQDRERAFVAAQDHFQHILVALEA